MNSIKKIINLFKSEPITTIFYIFIPIKIGDTYCISRYNYKLFKIINNNIN